MAFEGKNNEIAFPPLPRWPAEVYPDEAAHGFFQRLALENNQASVRTLATSLGLNARNIVPEAFLEMGLRFPVRNRDELAAATPKLRGKMVTFREQKFRYPRDWSTRRLRVCPGCLGERKYHRSWFDLNILAICPIHGCQLVESVESDRFGWWYPEIGVGPTTGLSVAAVMPRIEPTESFERYVLGRLGVIPEWKIPFLDGVALYQIIDIAERLGRARQEGWSKKRPVRCKRITADWRAQVSAGFDVLRGGPDEIGKSLRNYVLGNGIAASDSRIYFRFHKYWGWLWNDLLHVDSSPLLDCVRGIIVEIAAHEGIYSRRNLSAIRRRKETVNFDNLSARLNLTKRQLRRLVFKFGLADRKCANDQSVHFKTDQAARIEMLFQDLIDRNECAKILAVPVTEFDKCLQKYNLSPVIRLGGAQKTFDRFSKKETLKIAASVGAVSTLK